MAAGRKLQDKSYRLCATCVQAGGCVQPAWQQDKSYRLRSNLHSSRTKVTGQKLQAVCNLRASWRLRATCMAAGQKLQAA